MKRIFLLIFAIIAVVFVIGYAVSLKPTQITGSSGIYGTAMIGPTCPGAQRIGEVCTQPYQGTFIVKNQYGVQVSMFTTTASGEFRVSLLPGTYTIVQADKASSQKARVTTVTVTSGTYSLVNIQLDTGMR